MAVGADDDALHQQVGEAQVGERLVVLRLGVVEEHLGQEPEVRRVARKVHLQDRHP